MPVVTRSQAKLRGQYALLFKEIDNRLSIARCIDGKINKAGNTILRNLDKRIRELDDITAKYNNDVTRMRHVFCLFVLVIALYTAIFCIELKYVIPETPALQF